RKRITIVQGIIEWIIQLMESLGAPGVGIAILLENLFPPIPSEVVLPLAGFTISQGNLGFWPTFIWATAGSILGAWALYGIGAWIGAERLRKIADWMWLVEASDVDGALYWFDKYGPASVCVGLLKRVTLMALCTGLIITSRPRSFSAVSSPVFALLFPSPRALTGLTPLNLRSGQPSVQPVGTLLSSG